MVGTSSMKYLFIDDLEKLFESTASNYHVSRMFRYKELLDLIRIVGGTVPRTYVGRTNMVGIAREAMKTPPPLIPCAGCVLSGKRWVAANTGQPITYEIDFVSLSAAFDRAPAIMMKLFEFIKSKYGITFVQVEPGKVPDFRMRSEDLDGKHGTLGVTISYVSESDDIDVGEDRFTSVEVIMDSSENWFYDFFLTVMAHELFHLLGVDHAPEGIRDLMSAFFAGSLDFDQFGHWSHHEMVRRYIGLPGIL